MTRLYVHEDRIVAKDTPYELKDVMKAISGAAWDKRQYAWTYPISVHGALALDALFPDADADSYFIDLLRDASKLKEAQGLKVATDLPDYRSKTNPWTHQKQAYHFLNEVFDVGGGGLLAMDMGTGKSKVVVDLINNIDRVNKVLISCPLSVVDVWPEQFSIHGIDNYPVLALGGKMPVKKKATIAEEFMWANGERYVIVVNHDSLWRTAFGELVLEWPWDMYVADESHRLKSPSGKASMFAAKIGAEFRLGLTGTPMPHSPLDLYAQFRFIEPGLFGTSYFRFKTKYAVMGGFNGKQVIGFQSMEDLEEKLGSLTFQVKASDVLDLPESQHIVIPVKLNPGSREAYNSMRDDLIALVGSGVVTSANALVKLLRLQQIAQGTVKTDDDEIVTVGTEKLDALKDLLTDLPVNEPVVVFCLFHTDLDGVHRVAKEVGSKSWEISGRKKELELWNEHEGVLAVQIQSGGVGIDLTRARYAVYMSGTYSMGDYEQSLARVHRPGQSRNVTYYHINARGTVDTTVYAALRAKKSVVEAVLEGMKNEGA